MKLKPYHPLARGLKCALLMNEWGGSKLYDASNHLNTGFGTNIVWGRDGLNLPGSDERVTLSKIIQANGDWTIFCSFVQDAWSTDTNETHIVSMENGGSGTGRSILYIADAVGDNTYKLRSYLGGSLQEANTALELGNNYTVALTQNGTLFTFYLNGASDGSYNATAQSTYEDLILFDRKDSGGGGCLNGTVGLFYIYDRPLSDTEMKWLDRDPMGMFQPEIITPIIEYSAPSGIIIPILNHIYNQMRA